MRLYTDRSGRVYREGPHPLLFHVTLPREARAIELTYDELTTFPERGERVVLREEMCGVELRGTVEESESARGRSSGLVRFRTLERAVDRIF